MSAIPLPPTPPEKTSTTPVDPGYRDPHRLCEQAVRKLTAERNRLALQVGSGEVEIDQLRADVEHLRGERDGLRAEVERKRSYWAEAATERDALAARLAQAERVVEAARKLITWWFSVAAEAHDDPAQTHPLTPLRLAVDALDGTAGPGEEGSDG